MGVGVECVMQATEQWISPEEYLQRERVAEFKSEYYGGQVVAMAGTTRQHALIALNIGSRLEQQLRHRPCEAYMTEVKVYAASRKSYFYPDISVACGDIQFMDQHHDILLNPSVVFEVLSPSTEVFDRGSKWGEYQLLPSLQHYVLIAQDQVCVEVFTRSGEQWLYTRYTDPATELALTSIDCRLALADLYHKVTFDPPATDTPPAAP